MYSIIDGKYMGLSMEEILKEEGINLSQEIDYETLITSVIQSNQATIAKMKDSKKKSKKGGPIMFLVGEVMKMTNKQGNPKAIEQMIRERLQ